MYKIIIFLNNILLKYFQTIFNNNTIYFISNATNGWYRIYRPTCWVIYAQQSNYNCNRKFLSKFDISTEHFLYIGFYRLLYF